MTNPSALLRVALIGSTSPHAPNCDPAIDLDAPGCAAALSAYERERTDARRDAIPLRKDATLTLFDVQPLTAAGLRIATARSGKAQAHDTVALVCHSYRDARGADHKASDKGAMTPVGKVLMAGDEWLDHLFDTFGDKALTEIASIALLRAEAGPSALAPFVLPRGLMLAR